MRCAPEILESALVFERRFPLSNLFGAFLDFQIILLPGFEAAIHLHDGKARAGELNASFGGEMALL
jgi:hypothetical protein